MVSFFKHSLGDVDTLLLTSFCSGYSSRWTGEDFQVMRRSLIAVTESGCLVSVEEESDFVWHSE